MNLRTLSSFAYAYLACQPYTKQKKRAWLDTLLFSKLYRPLPYEMSASYIKLGWSNYRFREKLKRQCIIAVHIWKNNKLGLPPSSASAEANILAGADFRSIPKVYHRKEFLIDIELLEKMVRYYYEKELNIYTIKHK